MSADHPEELTEPATETATEPVPEPATAVVTRAEIILDNLAAQQQRILDDQAALADQLRAVIDSQRLLGHDLTMTLALAQTLANGQTAVLDEMRAIRGQLAQLCSRDTETLREQLRDIRALQDRIDTRLRTSENGLASLTAAKTPR